MISCISLRHGSFTAGLGLLQYSMECKAFQTILQNCIYLERCKLICYCEQHLGICVYEWRTKIRIRIFRLGKNNRDQIYYRDIIYEWDHWSWQCLKYIRLLTTQINKHFYKKSEANSAVVMTTWQLLCNKHALVPIPLIECHNDTRHVYRSSYVPCMQTIPIRKINNPCRIYGTITEEVDHEAQHPIYMGLILATSDGQPMLPSDAV